MSATVFSDAEVFTPDELPALASTDVIPARCAETGCTNPVTKPARGRTPKFCDDHKVTAGAGSKSATSGKSWTRAVEVENLLKGYVKGLGAGIALINSVDGEVIATGGGDVVHELVELAKTDRTIRKYLEFAATPGKYAPLTLAIFGLVMPILANHGMAPQFFVSIPSENK